MEEVEGGAGDARDGEELRLAESARVMMHGHFGEGATRGVQLANHLDADHAARRDEFDLLDGAPPDQTKVTVDVADGDAKHKARESVVNRADHFTAAAVGALDLVAVDDGDPVTHQRKQNRHLARVVLPVAVRVEDQVFARVAKPGAERRAVAFIPVVVDDPQVGQVLGQFVQHHAGSVRASVVHDDHFVVVGQCWKHGERILNQPRDGFFIVVCGEEDADTKVLR